jgi:acyl-CoA reductase-like NAD-dependent aldehyde dehydrogenase
MVLIVGLGSSLYAQAAQARTAPKNLSRALEYFAGMATKIQGDTIPVPGPYVNMTLREPLGVIGGIIPWNYPRRPGR